jgi:adenylate kinase family enzyme
MSLQIQKATKKAAKLRLALMGPSGAGKTFTALSVAKGLGARILVVDTENASASKYSDSFDFDVIELADFAPQNFIEAIALAKQNDYDVLVIDSLSHAWMGRGGILEMHDREVDRQKTKNSFTAWKNVTPEYNRLVEAIVRSRVHIIATLRSKTEHVVGKNDKNQTTVEKVGTQAVQREGLEYEFDVVGELRHEDNTLVITKTRCKELNGGVFRRAGADVAAILKDWLSGEEAPAEDVRRSRAEIRVEEAAKPVSSLSEAQQNIENKQLIADIKARLMVLNKSEEAFNRWFQQEYRTDLDWTQSGLAIKRELLDKIKGWEKKAA